MLQPTVEALVDKNVWIAHTGATSHLKNSRIGGVNHCNMTVKTRGFIGESINPDLKRNIPVMYIGDDGNQIDVELKDVQKTRSSTLIFSV